MKRVTVATGEENTASIDTKVKEIESNSRVDDIVEPEGSTEYDGVIVEPDDTVDDYDIVEPDDVITEGDTFDDAEVLDALTNMDEEGFFIDENYDELVGGVPDVGMIEDGTIYDPGFDMGGGMETEVKDPLLSSWLFALGISGAVLLVSIALGALLARRKIKKGIDLYEDY